MEACKTRYPNHFGEPQLLRFDKEISGIEAGTVIFEVRRSFEAIPHRNPLMLEAAIKAIHRFCGCGEKMNGHNVRITSMRDIVADQSLSALIPLVAAGSCGEIFERLPGLVLCAEMVGPENPYVSSESIHDSIDLYLFDVGKEPARTYGYIRPRR